MKKHLAALDGLRGIAILLVLLTHLLPHRQVATTFLRVLNGISGIGWSGVDIFFTLSGFLITGILFDAKNSSHYFRNFYMRRTLRIMPLYLLLVSFCMLVFPHFAATAGSAPAAHRWMFWLYLSNILVAFRGAVSVGWLGPLWSLAVEEHFYLVWPAVILFLSRRNAMRVCVACVVLANVTRLWFLSQHNLLGPYVFTLSRIDELAMGSWIALALKSQYEPAMLQRYATRCAWAAGGATAVLFVWRHGVILDPVMLGVGLPVVGLLSAAALTLAVLPKTAMPWKSVLQSRVLTVFGTYSYGLYMLHMPVWEMLQQHHLLLRGEGRMLDVLNLLLAVSISFVVAFLSYHLFEKHFLALKKFFPADARERPDRRSAEASAEPRPHRLSMEAQG